MTLSIPCSNSWLQVLKSALDMWCIHRRGFWEMCVILSVRLAERIQRNKDRHKECMQCNIIFVHDSLITWTSCRCGTLLTAPSLRLSHSQVQVNNCLPRKKLLCHLHMMSIVHSPCFWATATKNTNMDVSTRLSTSEHTCNTCSTCSTCSTLHTQVHSMKDTGTFIHTSQAHSTHSQSY